MRTLLAYIGCMAALAAAPAAQAQQKPPPPAAKVHYEAGAAHYQRGRYPEAIREFEEAYRLSQAPALLYNISQAYERLGDLKQARDYLQRYLDSGSAPADEKASLDDKVRSFDERIRADEQTKDNATQPATQPITGGGGGETARDFGVWKWAALGAGGVLLVTSAVFAWDAQRQEQKIEDAACQGSEPCVEYTYGGAWDRGERDVVLAWITGGLGIAAAGAGVTLLLLERSGSEAGSPSGSAQVAPLVAPHAAGATVGWKW